MRTGKRLTKINTMITASYQDIWDCCCDHGLLGIELLKRKAANTIHFVDISKPLIEKLDKQLQQFFSGEDYYKQWQVHALDVANIPLSKVKQGETEKAEQLVIIAGVGGDLLIELVQSIIYSNPKALLEFILCPVHHNYKVRTELINLDCNLINECIIKENNRFYEIMHITTAPPKKSTTPISNVGSIMWDFDNDDHQQYLQQCLNHYSRMLKSSNINAKAVVQAYTGLKE
ncbi:tRNA (adenine(22)-N(1))-methyltransferase TrmK [Thalassotalea fonticola]|uniref:tRNA (Adenine(22)-N(1))-methyltransferase TrmK n=1 Tax=Thalassotalea fonticola TaxID=3065649 RepID=A0ABZ0GTD7_9GAMM|nr:tRNA (adenine(22)-N(1))-methyltransferase TrmK [Colwelliaceae bacterium S1-1]